MKVLFVPFRETAETPEQYEIIKNSASSRLRCDWVSKYWEGSEVWKKTPDQLVPLDNSHDVYIFQKAFISPFLEVASRIKQFHRKIIFDLCDAEWVYPSRKERLGQMIALADHITVSSKYLQDYIRKNYRGKEVSFIPDRLDLDHYPDKDKKKHVAGKELFVVWYGNRNTIPFVNLMQQSLYNVSKRIPFTLTLISDQFDEYHPDPALTVSLKKIIWTLEGENKAITSGDVVINPHIDNEIGRAKSDNKNISAWALGMPVVTNHGSQRVQETLLTAYLSSSILRHEVGTIGFKRVHEFYDIRISAIEFKMICESLFKKR